MTSEQSQLEGQQIGRYIVRQRLGGGGVATVYQAYDQVSGQSVALKVLPPNPDSATLDRFRREALMAGALRHPHIVRILQVGTVGDGPSAYIAMDLVEGESLAALLTRFGQLRPEESCLLLEPIARALAFAHSQGVIHRDVKPSNILLRPVSLRPIDLDPTNADATHGVRLELLEHSVIPLLSDFGIARFLDAPELTNTGRTVGTPAFMAPEQCMGSRVVDGRADIYSLGTVLYRCVVGRLPFNGSTTQILHAHVFEPVVIEEEMVQLLPPRVVQILRRTLAKAPEDRYQDARMLAEELAAVGTNAHVAKVTAAPTAMETMPTSTLTMAQVAAMTQPEPSVVHILVPGTTNVESAATAAKTQPASPRKRGPSLERILWAAFYVLLIGGGGLYTARTWLVKPSNGNDALVSLPRVFLATFTPTAVEIEVPHAQSAFSMTTPTVAAAVAVSATMLPTETSAPLPTDVLPTDVPPTRVPTEVPTMVPTQVPDDVDVQAPTSTPTLVAKVVITSGEEIAGLCITVVDEFFLPTVAQLSDELRADFGCPTGPATFVQGEWMTFAQGTMVAIEGTPFVYVNYANGAWEQVASGDGNVPPIAAPEGDVEVPQLPPPFGSVLATQGRYLLLGKPTQGEPLQSDSAMQPFSGGILIGNRSNGQILLLARSKLRF